MKRTGLHGYVYDVSVDYDAIAVDDILDIHKYLIKKMTQCKNLFELVKKAFAGLTILSSLASVNSLSCISMNTQECKIRPQIVNVDSNELVFYPFSIKTSKAVAFVAILIAYMQSCVFLML